MAPKGMGGGGQPLPTPSIAPPTLGVLCLRGVEGVGGCPHHRVSPRLLGWLHRLAAGAGAHPLPCCRPPTTAGGKDTCGGGAATGWVPSVAFGGAVRCVSPPSDMGDTSLCVSGGRGHRSRSH